MIRPKTGRLLSSKTAFYGLFCVGMLTVRPLIAQAAEASSTSQNTPVCLSLVVPSYMYPAQADSGWDTLIATPSKTHQAQHILIANPASGPGTAANSDFQNVVAKAHGSGQKVYGYVATGYGKVPLATAQEQVEKYKSWYKVDGIFVDEVSSEANEVAPYYQPLSTFITSAIKGGGVVLNNGTYPDSSYALIKVPSASKLQIVVFEHDYAAFTANSFVVPKWIQDHPASMFINIVYDVSGNDWKHVLDLSRERNVGAVYVTDKTLPNPYAVLPPYWSELNHATQTGCTK